MVKAIVDTMVWASALASKSKYCKEARNLISNVLPVIPANIAAELFNVLVKDMNVGEKRAAATVIKLMEEADTMDMKDEHIMAALQIAAEHNVRVFDAIILAEAILEGLPIITFDRKLRAVGRKMNVHVIP